jgi:hypothetical protein
MPVFAFAKDFKVITIKSLPPLSRRMGDVVGELVGFEI